MDLFVLRHGEAGKHSAIPSDSLRALTAAGRQEMVEIAKGLEKLGIEFDHVFSSPLTRAKQTAIIALKYVKSKNNIENADELRPEGNRLELYTRLSKLKQSSIVLLVGHEPYLSELISEAISGDLDDRIDLKKGGLARINVIKFLPKIQGELRWLLPPKVMKKFSK